MDFQLINDGPGGMLTYPVVILEHGEVQDFTDKGTEGARALADLAAAAPYVGPVLRDAFIALWEAKKNEILAADHGMGVILSLPPLMEIYASIQFAGGLPLIMARTRVASRGWAPNVRGGLACRLLANDGTHLLTNGIVGLIPGLNAHADDPGNALTHFYVRAVNPAHDLRDGVSVGLQCETGFFCSVALDTLVTPFAVDIGPKETWTLYVKNGAQLGDGSTVSLQGVNGLFMCAENGGGGTSSSTGENHQIGKRSQFKHASADRYARRLTCA